MTTVYTDDADAGVRFFAEDHDGADIDFPPTCAIGPGGYTVTGTWLDDPAPVRRIRVPLAGLAPDQTHNVYLKVPGDSDLLLGTVYVQTRH